MTSKRTPVRYGDTTVSYKMTAYAPNDRVMADGQAWANADTVEGARETANRWLAKGYMGRPVAYVEISGGEYVFKGSGWAMTHNREHNFFERIERTTPLPFTAADRARTCYDTMVFDVFETVHERRSDGSCRCGKHASRFGN
ncbi:hypothetical protein [Amycolatopsis sp. DSM 110486]|uniref:hypothetical protein n=1 Tax=Amycolatopsis sp. DSM 110486 TaxID=2865832 RepID=UPI001C6A6867|nr:hypothetical protein [Amycolatopsis sp. DSM 110486]QYN17556.1 hypothetical protein K1T34_32745 [Amycolatopsis sp. DSM 110486]